MKPKSEGPQNGGKRRGKIFTHFIKTVADQQVWNQTGWYTCPANIVVILKTFKSQLINHSQPVVYFRFVFFSSSSFFAPLLFRLLVPFLFTIYLCTVSVLIFLLSVKFFKRIKKKLLCCVPIIRIVINFWKFQNFGSDVWFFQP